MITISAGEKTTIKIGDKFMNIGNQIKTFRLEKKAKQEELAEYLKHEGFKITQATVSRDIRDLKLTKVPTDGGRQKIV